MNGHKIQQKQFEIDGINSVNELYAKRGDDTIFANVPFTCPRCGAPLLFLHTTDKHYEQRKQFEQHFFFWDEIAMNVNLFSRAIGKAIDRYVGCKSKPETSNEEYKQAEADLIKEIEAEHKRLPDIEIVSEEFRLLLEERGEEDE